MPKLASLLKATASGSARIEAYEIDLKRFEQKTRQLIVNAKVLDDVNKDHIRLLVAITDVTDARADAKQKDDLVGRRQSSFRKCSTGWQTAFRLSRALMQSARRVQSEEARGHLHNAHNRVMSIAAVQRQLSTSSVGIVELRSYFTQLGESLGASMIADEDRLSIAITVDDSAVEADVSLSFGLIVTELVINAPEAAFQETAGL